MSRLSAGPSELSIGIPEMSLPSAPAGFFFKGQLMHLLAMTVLLAGAFLVVDFKQLDGRRVLGRKPTGIATQPDANAFRPIRSTARDARVQILSSRHD
jgi:hypothetical protein